MSTRRQRRAERRKQINKQNAIYYALNKAALLAKQKAVRDDKREDLRATEGLKP